MARPKNEVMQSRFTLSDGTTVLGVSSVHGTIQSWRTVINGAVTTNNAVCTLKVNGTAVSGGAITVTAASSAQGDVDEAKSCKAAVKPGDVISVTVSGTPGGAQTAIASIVIDL